MLFRLSFLFILFDNGKIFKNTLYSDVFWEILFSFGSQVSIFVPYFVDHQGHMPTQRSRHGQLAFQACKLGNMTLNYDRLLFLPGYSSFIKFQTKIRWITQHFLCCSVSPIFAHHCSALLIIAQSVYEHLCASKYSKAEQF